MVNKKIRKELGDFCKWADKKDFLISDKPESIFIRARYSDGTLDERKDIHISDDTISYVQKHGPLVLSNKNSYLLYHTVEGANQYFQVRRIALFSINEFLKI